MLTQNLDYNTIFNLTQTFSKSPIREVWLNSIFSEAGLFPTILGNGPWPKLGKNDRLNSNIGGINNIEHNKGSKIYPQNQVILDCIMPIIPLSKAQVFKYHSDIGIFSH